MVRICGAQELRPFHSDHLLSEVLIDSRQLSRAEATLFFALPGHRRDGHDFIPALYQRGVRHFVVSRSSWDCHPYPEAQFLLVPSTLLALHALAIYWRKKHEMPVVGITGSNGKTMVKDWLSYLLEQHLHVVRSPKSYNSQIGVPISILQLESGADLGVFEAGISTTGEMAKLAAIIRPSVGVLTNLGSAHDAGFSSREEKLGEKLKLFEEVDILVVRHAWQEQVKHFLPHTKLFVWDTGGQSGCDLEVQIDRQPHSTSLSCSTAGQTIRLGIPFQDDASVENIIHCLAVLLVLDLDIADYIDRFQSLPQISMRLETIYGRNGCIIINDSYNADLEALRVAMSRTQQYPQMPRTLIISDFDQVTDAASLHRQIGLHLRQFGFAKVIAVGEDFKMLEMSDLETKVFASTDALLGSSALAQLSGELIVLKGARRFRFERIAEVLSAKSYGGKLQVDLSALASNIKAFEKLLAPKTLIMAMIKAAAYGSGAVAMAHNLTARGIDYFGVAYADEGVELRRGGIHLPIMVLNTEEASIDQLFDFSLEPEVHSQHLLMAIGRQSQIRRQSINLHLNVDTGMNRLGFAPSEIIPVLEILNQFPYLKVTAVMSHLVASDDPASDAFTNEQGLLFEQTCRTIEEWLDYRPLRHICNSNGIVRFPHLHHDLVRLGIGMYGVGVKHLGLKPVHTLSCRISRIQKIVRGSSIGYGRSEIAEHDQVIATIGIGYADGLIRKLGNRRYSVLVRGEQAPLVGNVCMDMAMIDITAIPEVMVGDEVVVFGEHLPLEGLAQAAETIPYEIFTSISQRVQRVYIQE